MSTVSKNLKEQIVGAWSLVSFIETPVDGSPHRFPMGEDPKGVILYTDDGYMSAQLMRSHRSAFAGQDWTRGTPEEYAEAASGYLAYSGPYEVDEENRKLLHTMDVALFPAWVGQKQIRLARLEGDTLQLSTENPILSGDKKVTLLLVWRRAKHSL